MEQKVTADTELHLLNSYLLTTVSVIHPHIDDIGRSKRLQCFPSLHVGYLLKAILHVSFNNRPKTCHLTPGDGWGRNLITLFWASPVT